jgi:hypothetical protein
MRAGFAGIIKDIFKADPIQWYKELIVKGLKDGLPSEEQIIRDGLPLANFEDIEWQQIRDELLMENKIRIERDCWIVT